MGRFKKKWVTKGKVCQIWKNGSQLEKSHTLSNGSNRKKLVIPGKRAHLEKWVILGKIGHTWKNVSDWKNGSLLKRDQTWKNRSHLKYRLHLKKWLTQNGLHLEKKGHIWKNSLHLKKCVTPQKIWSDLNKH